MLGLALFLFLAIVRPNQIGWQAGLNACRPQANGEGIVAPPYLQIAMVSNFTVRRYFPLCFT